MHIALWVLQVALAIKLASTAYTHGLHRNRTSMQMGLQRLGAVGRLVLIVTALCSFAGALGLVVPGAIGVAPWLTPWSAALIALLMLVAACFHIRCRREPKVWVSLVLCALAAFVAIGRWVLAPL